jgi:molecular chaperone DnaJ
MYDRFGHAGLGGAATGGFDPNAFSGFEDILGGLGDIFGFGDVFGGGRRRGGPQRGADLRYDLEISFDEAAAGTETAIQIPRHEACETCQGSGAAAGTKPTTCQQCQGRGQLRYQQGFFTVARTCGQCRGTGSVIARISGEGEAGAAGGSHGDLYVVVHVQEHPFWQRDGNDLYCEIPVNFPTLALGGEIIIPTLDGDETFKIPDGTQTGSAFRLRGRGMPDVGGRGRGDLIVTVKVITPKKLTKDQKKLLEQLQAELPKEKFEPTPADSEDKGLFERVKDIFG